jgi:hypothetical protein
MRRDRFYRLLLLTCLGALAMTLPPIGSALEATAWQTDVLGYGDIAPIHPLAQLASVGLSVLGPLYITVVIGVVVSRSLTDRSGD